MRILQVSASTVRKFCKLGFVSIALIGAGLVTPDANAFTWLATPPPVTMAIDDNSVDLGTGNLVFSTTEVVIGQPDAGGLSYTRTFIGAGWRDSLAAGINSAGLIYTVSVGGASETFTSVSGAFTSDQASGATLTYNSGTQIYTYTTSRGVVIVFDKALANASIPWGANEGSVTSITAPTGLITAFHYNSATVSGVTWRRLQSVTNNVGYQLHLEYSLDTPTAPGDLTAWQTLSKVIGINNAIDYCAPTAFTCTGLTVMWPSATYAESGGVETVTDAAGDVTRYVYTSGQLTGIRRPTSPSTNTITIARSSGRVSSVTGPSGAWTYAYADASGIRTTTATNTDGLSGVRVARVQIASNRVQDISLGGVTSYEYTYDGFGRVDTINDRVNTILTEFDYDARGNITHVARNASTETFAAYPASCANPVTCNLPTQTTDEMGQSTDYTYNATHGGVISITSPDPDGAGALPRPQTRFDYASFYAYYKNGGGIVAAASPVTLMTQTSACATLASCGGTLADATISVVTYGATGVANNLLPTAVSAGAGDGSLTATTVTTYTPAGDIEARDGPLSGTADTTRFRYDVARRLVGVIGPDPDGGGALKYRAQRTTYNADGQPTLVEQGTVDSQSDSDWAAFASLEASSFGYDAQGRAIQTSRVASSTTYAVAQASYDAIGRQTCAAIRMNPAVFGSLPSSACTLSTEGANGPDRITHQSYDSVSRPLVRITGYATPAPIAEATLAYDGAARVPVTMTDANGNITRYQYGDLQRLSYIFYPATNGDPYQSSGNEQFSYNARGQVTAFRRRDGATISTTYDNLGRATLTDVSTGADVTTAYDNFNRVTSTSVSGHALSYAYDQLSRLISETSPQGTVGYQYDLASRRTRMTWPDAFYVTYDVDLYDAITAIRENGAGSGAGVLATYAYDNLGRRTTLTRGNGVVTTYGYDAVSRLTNLASDLASTSQDDSRAFTFDASSGIASRTLSNNSYAQSFAAGGAFYAPNGLNQYGRVNNGALTYDARGNLTSDGVNSYGYDIFNRLTSRSSASFSYDPAGRLYSTASGGVTTTMLYDGATLIGEYSGSTLLRRFVHGPGVDEPIVWYEGSGTSDRRSLVADERGSVVAVTNASGAATGAGFGINTYDEYGVSGGANVGRFQYTGQSWLSDAGVYDYGARSYAPQLGRFLQPDPIGSEGGIVLYAYVLNDPVNAIDPDGLCGWFAEYQSAAVYDSHGNVIARDALMQTATGYEPCAWDDWRSIDLGAGVRGARDGGGGRIHSAGALEHHYEITRYAMCPASETFAMFKLPGMSAPGAPAAREGFASRIILFGNNPISQSVNSSTMSITNTTLPGHYFYNGTVRIRVVAVSANVSGIHIVGEGSGPRPLQNDVAGIGFFGAVAESIANMCTASAGVFPNHGM